MKSNSFWHSCLFLMIPCVAFAQGSSKALVAAQQLEPAVSGSGAIGDRFGRTLDWDAETLAIGAIGDEVVAPGLPDGLASGTVSIYRDGIGGLVLEAQLVPSTASGDDRFGFALALSGDLVAIGAPFEDVDAQEDRGAVYVFRRTAGAWTMLARLVAPDGAPGDFFGFALDVDAGGLVVGAPRALAGQGKAYRYTHDGQAFTLAATLVPGEAGAEAGRSVALGNNAVFVGAPMSDAGALDAGAVYCFARVGGLCGTPVLVSNTPAADARFGATMREHAGRLVVGAPAEGSPGVPRRGAVYAFDAAANGAAMQRQRLVAPDGTADGAFGSSLALDAGTLAVGAPGALAAEGAAYVFVESGANYVPQQNFSEPDGGLADLFGAAVAVSGDRLAIGVELDNVDPNRAQGSVATFRRSGATWSATPRLVQGDGASRERFGGAVALHDGLAIVGAAYDDPALDQDDAGSATLYRRDATGWVRESRVVAADLFTQDLFGYAVDVTDGYAIVGAPRAIIAGRIDQGAAYVFRHDAAGGWQQDAKLVAPNGQAMQFFGAAVAIDGDTALVGVPFEDGDSLEAGAAYVYRRGAAGWQLEARLSSPAFPALGAAGLAVALDGDVAVLGAPDSSSETLQFIGFVQVFVREGTNWRHAATVAAPDGTAGDAFGSAVAIDADELLIGAAQDTEATFVNAGSAYVFRKGAADTWTFVRRLVSPQPSRAALFGASVSISDGRALIGSFGFDGAATNTGAAFLFERGAGDWPMTQSLEAAVPQAGALFGFSVSLGPVAALVGEPLRDRVNPNEGAAYVYVDDDRLFSNSFE